MKLEAAIAKSPLGIAARPARPSQVRKGERQSPSVYVMRVKGELHAIDSPAYPRKQRRVYAFDLQSTDWQPVLQAGAA